MMGKIRKFIKSPAFIIVLFAAAALLIAGGSIGGVRAAISNSEVYQSQLEVNSISVVLNEATARDNVRAVCGTGIDSIALLEHITKDNFRLGKEFFEELSVTNNGSIDEYVRVTITRYWEKDGEKLITLAPEAIDLNLLEGNGWVIDPDAETEERIVLYYTLPLGVGETSLPLSDVIRIDPDVALGATDNKSDYDGATFHLEARVDAVQTHNAAHAIMSAWGRSVTITGGTLSLD